MQHPAAQVVRPAVVAAADGAVVEAAVEVVAVAVKHH